MVSGELLQGDLVLGEVVGQLDGQVLQSAEFGNVNIKRYISADSKNEHKIPQKKPAKTHLALSSSFCFCPWASAL